MSAIAPWRVLAILPPLVADAAREQHEERGEREREQRQPPVQQHHRDDRRQHGRHVRDDRGRGARDDVLHAADVVGDPRLDLARAGAREEGEREPLEVAVDLRAQVVHDLLADHVGEPGLADAEHAGGDGDGDHPRHQQRRAACRRSSGIATSRTSRSRNGEMIPSPAETTISASTAASRPR